MKFTFAFLFLSVFAISSAQQSYTPATITEMDGANKSVYLTSKKSIPSNAKGIVVYKEKKSSSGYLIEAKDFEVLTTADGSFQLLSTILPGFEKEGKMILMKLTEGSRALYSFEMGEKKYFVDAYQGNFTVLSRKPTNGGTLNFKEFLFRNFNNADNPSGFYIDLNYTTSDLVEYYLDNDSNMEELSQLPKVKFFELGAFASYNSFAFSLSDRSQLSYEDLEDSNVSFGFKAFFNIDRAKNTLTGFVGVEYLNLEAEAPSVFAQQSAINRREATTSMSATLLVFKIGGMYNIHFDHFSVSPYVSFDPSIFLGDNEVRVTFDDDDSVYYETDIFLNDPASFSAGVQVNAFNNFYGFIEYSAVSDFNPVVKSLTGGYTVNGDGHRIGFGLGYKFL